MKKHFQDVLLLFVVSLAFLVSLAALPAAAAPKKEAKPWDCYSCHEKTDKILSDDHKSTEGMTLESCSECHRQGGKSARLAGKIPLAHTHLLSGMTCAKCHGDGKKKEAVETEVCESCHDPLKVSQKTANVKPENPHISPHYDTSLNCTYCHHQHESSENFCIECHAFKFTVP